MERLVKANLRFVVSVAKQYQHASLPLNDLINEGNLGLVKAAQRFDETKGFKFISYAVWWIRQSILQALGEHARLIRLPLNKIATLARVQEAFSELEQKHQREPLEEEMGGLLGMNQRELAHTLRMSARHLSLDAPFAEAENSTLLDVMEDENIRATDSTMAYRESLTRETCRALKSLPERQRQVILLYFGIGREYPMALDDIGKVVGVTKERVRQIKDKAIDTLRQSGQCEMLKEYLG